MNGPEAPTAATGAHDKPPRERVPSLSKSRFLSGLQCHKRLWLECYRRDLASPFDDLTKALLESGARVGTLARERVPGGCLIEDDHLHHDDAVRHTRAALADRSLPALYEAAFTCYDVRVRVDVLARNDDGSFDLIEVKASTGVKEEHLADLAVQLLVLEGTGLRVRRACLMHLNGDYVYPGGDYDLASLFRLRDLTPEVRERQARVRGELELMRRPLGSEAPPAIEVGAHCRSPYGCPFLPHCTRDEPEHPVRNLPRLGPALFERIRAAGIRDLRDLDPGFPGLDLRQRRACEAVRSGRRFVDPDLGPALARLPFPVRFVDFETFMPALPVFPGTRPYETVPFQWSLHTLHADGTVAHDAFLHDGEDDPREAFAASLLSAVGDDGAIIVWSGYEGHRLRDLESAMPARAGALAQVRSRLFDLLEPVRRQVYDAGFRGSFSLKSVAPALLPHLGYDDLAIREGGTASLAYEELRDPATGPARARELRAHLLAYCARDTEMVLELFRLLRSPGLTSGGDGPEPPEPVTPDTGPASP